MSNLRQQVIDSQKSRSDLLKWKLILIAAIGSFGLGFKDYNINMNNSYLILPLIPLICIYVDALCMHLFLRIYIIGAFFRNYYKNHFTTDDLDALYEDLLFFLNGKMTNKGLWHSFLHFITAPYFVFKKSSFNFELLGLFWSTIIASILIIVYGFYNLSCSNFEFYIFIFSGLFSIMCTSKIHLYKKEQEENINSYIDVWPE